MNMNIDTPSISMDIVSVIIVFIVASGADIHLE